MRSEDVSLFLSIASTKSPLLLFGENGSLHTTFLPAGFLSEKKRGAEDILVTKLGFVLATCGLQ